MLFCSSLASLRGHFCPQPVPWGLENHTLALDFLTAVPITFPLCLPSFTYIGVKYSALPSSQKNNDRPTLQLRNMNFIVKSFKSSCHAVPRGSLPRPKDGFFRFDMAMSNKTHSTSIRGHGALGFPVQNLVH